MPTPPAPLTLSALYVYPIKSAGGIQLDSSEVGPRGLHLDRRWMVIDQGRQPVTQRQFPRMRQLQVTLEGAGLRVEAPGMPRLHVPAQPQNEGRSIDFWGHEVGGTEVSDEVTAWFSDYLEDGCTLLHLPDDVERWQPTDRPYRSLLAYVDGNPFNLITAASLADLNTRSPRPVTVHDFRPNLLIGGDTAPYSEDCWRRIRVGELHFEVVESCARCSMVNVTEEGRMSAEPLRTLTRTRQRDRKVPFGQNMVQDAPYAERTGRLRVGDVLEVLEVGDTPNPMY
ncbi:MOSC N-terminal beta barrel domain-containing protein (plasmid) [Deinococcus sp. KNUC1210]|uniref:MOSC domain-containing protein n=1 Tax=Deinococcus sp. KNUC1210 TaxID=2917691 RepID=UPI001EF155AA|nr:MOSC N-terminal beta barrel domain-containing protein [Deinococcus sp. KNUC1210]ULH17130.1 MOSC N-terminal beta barrel domain-containing protein [Deinococcus sp. KNUC1210]